MTYWRVGIFITALISALWLVPALLLQQSLTLFPIWMTTQNSLLLATLLVSIILCSWFVIGILFLCQQKESLWLRVYPLGLLLWGITAVSISSFILYQLGDTLVLVLPWQSWLFIWFADPSIRCLLLILSGGIFLLGFLPIVIKFFHARNPNLNLYGRARFATFSDCKKAGLFNSEGILLGTFKRQLLRIGGHEHIVVFSPSGTGKSSALVIPNLLTNAASMVVNDVKFELFRLTSGYRQAHGHRCFLWAPSRNDRLTHAYNPLDFVPRDKQLRIKYLQKNAGILIPENHHSDPIWYSSPRKIFVAIALYLLDTPGSLVTLGEINRTVKQTNFFSWLEDNMKKRDDLDPLFYRDMTKLLELDHRTRSNIIESFTIYFSLWDDPLIDAATSHSDFDVRNLRREKMTIYVGFSADDMERLSPLLTMFWQQVLDAMVEQEPKTDEPYTVILMLDEFAILRRMESFKSTIGLLRSYHVRVVIFLQNLAQIASRYGKEDASVFIDAKVKATFGLSDKNDALFMSEQLGDRTVKIRQRSFQQGMQSVSIHYQKRPLMLYQEIMDIQDQLIVKIQAQHPVRVGLLRWYEDALLQRRVLKALDLINIRYPLN
ncbi:MAG: type IV secretory system conjugative DNA transfer family protein [Legionellales bacterium]|nr:type IV secretory system conjugative DNA transfer family protein [Legionellales bacterium]